MKKNIIKFIVIITGIIGNSFAQVEEIYWSENKFELSEKKEVHKLLGGLDENYYVFSVSKSFNTNYSIKAYDYENQLNYNRSFSEEIKMKTGLTPHNVLNIDNQTYVFFTNVIKKKVEIYYLKINTISPYKEKIKKLTEVDLPFSNTTTLFGGNGIGFVINSTLPYNDRNKLIRLSKDKSKIIILNPSSFSNKKENNKIKYFIYDKLLNLISQKQLYIIGTSLEKEEEFNIIQTEFSEDNQLNILCSKTKIGKEVCKGCSSNEFYLLKEFDSNIKAINIDNNKNYDLINGCISLKNENIYIAGNYTDKNDKSIYAEGNYFIKLNKLSDIEFSNFFPFESRLLIEYKEKTEKDKSNNISNINQNSFSLLSNDKHFYFSYESGLSNIVIFTFKEKGELFEYNYIKRKIDVKTNTELNQGILSINSKIDSNNNFNLQYTYFLNKKECEKMKLEYNKAVANYNFKIDHRTNKNSKNLIFVNRIKNSNFKQSNYLFPPLKVENNTHLFFGIFSFGNNFGFCKIP